MSESSGFSFGKFVDDIGGAVQTGATDWFKSEVAQRTQPKQAAQPTSTMSVAMADMQAAFENNKKVLLALLAFILVGGFIFAIKGRRSGRRK